jgi:hypothetical protein
MTYIIPNNNTNNLLILLYIFNPSDKSFDEFFISFIRSRIDNNDIYWSRIKPMDDIELDKFVKQFSTRETKNYCLFKTVSIRFLDDKIYFFVGYCNKWYLRKEY